MRVMSIAQTPAAFSQKPGALGRHLIAGIGVATLVPPKLSPPNSAAVSELLPPSSALLASPSRVLHDAPAFIFEGALNCCCRHKPRRSTAHLVAAVVVVIAGEIGPRHRVPRVALV